ncbi:MAG: hypothetical protein FJ196_05580 [Gammaproteobacteria bacterium]|nr:hypothetical protein [Gammaproteobacteria bacterium]
MSTENDVKAGEAAKADNPLETLTSLVLDAADAANDSAQMANEAISRLSRVVDANLDTTRVLRNAPAIFGAVILSIGIGVAVVVAMVFSKIDERAAALTQAITAQDKNLEKVSETVKTLSTLESDLKKFENIANDTTQRAVVTLREQVKADRLAIQELEARRLNEILASFRNAVSGAPPPSASREKSPSSVEAAIVRIDGRLAAIAERTSGEGAAKRPIAVLSDAQAKDVRATAAEVGQLKQEIAGLRELIERRGSELQSGVPVIKPQGN